VIGDEGIRHCPGAVSRDETIELCVM